MGCCPDPPLFPCDLVYLHQAKRISDLQSLPEAHYYRGNRFVPRCYKQCGDCISSKCPFPVLLIHHMYSSVSLCGLCFHIYKVKATCLFFGGMNINKTLNIEVWGYIRCSLIMRTIGTWWSNMGTISITALIKGQVTLYPRRKRRGWRRPSSGESPSLLRCSASILLFRFWLSLWLPLQFPTCTLSYQSTKATLAGSLS